MTEPERPSEYHRRLPYGERVSAEPVLGDRFFPFDGDLQVVPLAEPEIQRVAGAIREIPEVARTHFNRWGDGSEHFHVWFLARPLGMMQLRGPMIAIWDDLLPNIPTEEFERNARLVATALAATGGAPLGIAAH